jgi:hypothetical protein
MPDARIEELDLERAILDARPLPNELVETRLADLAAAVGGRIGSVRVAGRGAVQAHLEANGVPVLPRRQHEVQVAAVEPEDDPAACGLEHAALGADVPRSDETPFVPREPVRYAVRVRDVSGHPPAKRSPWR